MGAIVQVFGQGGTDGLTFPRVNEAAFLRRVKRIAMLIGLVVWVLLLSLVAWMLFMGSKYLEVAG